MSWDGGMMHAGGLTDDDVYAAMAAATAHSQAAAEVHRARCRRDRLHRVEGVGVVRRRGGFAGAELDGLHDLKILAGRRRLVLAVVTVEAEDSELRRAQHVRRRVLLAGAEDDAAADEQHQPFSRQPHAQGADSDRGRRGCEERKKSASLL